MVTDLEEVRRTAEAKRAENLEFRRFLKAHHHRDEPFRILARQIEREIDCTQCANCCRVLEVNVTEPDLQAIATYLRMSLDEVIRAYAEWTPDGFRLLSDEAGCVFLDGNLCMVYDARPKPCRDFPHSDLRERSLGGRMESQCRRASVCPIVFNALEAYKRLTGFLARRV